MMNLIEATNYFLGEDDESNGIMAMVAKVLKMFEVDTSLFTDPQKAKEFLNSNQGSFAKAYSLYNKVSGVSESYMSEGVFDMFSGLNKSVIIMFVFIAISGALGKAHATIDDLVNNMRAVASQVKVIDTDYNNPQAGYQIKQTGHNDVKKILQGLDPEELKRIKAMAEKEGLTDWNRVKAALSTLIVGSFATDKTPVLQRLNGLDGRDLKTLIDVALSKVK